AAVRAPAADEIRLPALTPVERQIFAHDAQTLRGTGRKALRDGDRMPKPPQQLPHQRVRPGLCERLQTCGSLAVAVRAAAHGTAAIFCISIGVSTFVHRFVGFPARIASSSRKMMRRSNAIPASEAPSRSRVRSWTTPWPRTAV